MGKIESIRKYAPMYLKGKPEAFIAAFNEKDIDKQYSAVMTWKSRQKKHSAKEEAATSAESVLAHIEQTRAIINTLPARLSAEEIARIIRGVENLKGFMEEYKELARREEIARLESQKEEISRRLQELRNGSEPSLFD